MTANHLLSASLFAELFQHNLVSPDGRIIANEQQLRDYSTFLIKQSKEGVASLYAERKNLVNDVEELLRLDFRTEEEEKLLKDLINELDLKFDDDGLLILKEPRKPKRRYLGLKEPRKSIFQRKVEAELESIKILKRDLRKLDDWLEQISHFSRVKDQEQHFTDLKEAGIKYRQRTTNRMCDMRNARTKLIKHHYKDYDKTLSSVLHRKLPKEKYLTRLPNLKAEDTKCKVSESKTEEKEWLTEGEKYEIDSKDDDMETDAPIFSADENTIKGGLKNENEIENRIVDEAPIKVKDEVKEHVIETPVGDLNDIHEENEERLFNINNDRHKYAAEKNEIIAENKTDVKSSHSERNEHEASKTTDAVNTTNDSNKNEKTAPKIFTKVNSVATKPQSSINAQRQKTVKDDSNIHIIDSTEGEGEVKGRVNEKKSVNNRENWAISEDKSNIKGFENKTEKSIDEETGIKGQNKDNGVNEITGTGSRLNDEKSNNGKKPPKNNKNEKSVASEPQRDTIDRSALSGTQNAVDKNSEMKMKIITKDEDELLIETAVDPGTEINDAYQQNDLIAQKDYADEKSPETKTHNSTKSKNTAAILPVAEEGTENEIKNISKVKGVSEAKDAVSAKDNANENERVSRENTVNKNFVTKVHNAQDVDDVDSREIVIMIKCKSSNKDTNVESRNAADKNSVRGFVGNVIDEDVVTQIQLDAEKEKNINDENSERSK